MDRFNTQRIIRRIKAAGSHSPNQPANKATTKTYAKWLGALALTFVVISLCTLPFMGQQSNGASSVVGYGHTEPMMAATPAAMADTLRSGYSNEANLAAPSTDSATGVDSSAQQSAYNSTTNQTKPQPWDRKIIRTATLQLTVKDVGTSLDKVRLLADLHGGYVFTSDSHQDGEYTVANVTIQVPTQEFDRIMPELRKLDDQVKKIGSENVSSSDVTEEYTDLQSQLRNLQSTEVRMLALQQKAEKLEDILTLDQQLRTIQGDIERIQGRLNFLGNRSDLSSISINLSPDMLPVKPIDPEPAQGWNPVEIARKAWEASLDLLSKVATVGITVAVFMWWAVPLLLLALVVSVRLRKQPAPPAGSATSAGEAGA